MLMYESSFCVGVLIILENCSAGSNENNARASGRDETALEKKPADAGDGTSRPHDRSNRVGRMDAALRGGV
jgi:hypothetical protein